MIWYHSPWNLNAYHDDINNDMHYDMGHDIIVLYYDIIVTSYDIYDIISYDIVYDITGIFDIM